MSIFSTIGAILLLCLSWMVGESDNAMFLRSFFLTGEPEGRAQLVLAPVFIF
jgi:hypothetical protein